MAKEQVDLLWNQATKESIQHGDMFTRYCFAELVAAKEREHCAQLCDAEATTEGIAQRCAEAIRERGK